MPIVFEKELLDNLEHKNGYLLGVLENRWNLFREDMVAEFHCFSRVDASFDLCVKLSHPRPKEGDCSYYFEMPYGIPIVSLRKEGEDGSIGPYVGFIGDSFGSESEAARKSLDSDSHRISGTERSEVLTALLAQKDAVREAFLKLAVRNRDEESIPRSEIPWEIASGIMLDEGRVDRAYFYGRTMEWSRKELFELREDVSKEVAKGYGSLLNSAHEVDRIRGLEMVSKAEADIEKTFSNWSRVSGRLDWRVMNLGMVKGEVTVGDVVKTADWAMRNPNLAVYRDRVVSNWVFNSCLKNGLDYTKVPLRLKCPSENMSI